MSPPGRVASCRLEYLLPSRIANSYDGRVLYFPFHGNRIKLRNHLPRAPDGFQSVAANLLREVQRLSGNLRTAADQLTSHSLLGLSWESHAHRLSVVRENVNQIGSRLTRLQDIHHVTSPLQQQTIDRVVPVAAEVASHTQAAIEHLNENRSYLFAPAYTDHLNAIAGGAEEMKASLDNFLDYGSAQGEMQRLEEKLGIAQS